MVAAQFTATRELCLLAGIGVRVDLRKLAWCHLACIPLRSRSTARSRCQMQVPTSLHVLSRASLSSECALCDSRRCVAPTRWRESLGREGSSSHSHRSPAASTPLFRAHPSIPSILHCFLLTSQPDCLLQLLCSLCLSASLCLFLSLSLLHQAVLHFVSSSSTSVVCSTLLTFITGSMASHLRSVEAVAAFLILALVLGLSVSVYVRELK